MDLVPTGGNGGQFEENKYLPLRQMTQVRLTKSFQQRKAAFLRQVWTANFNGKEGSG